MQINKKSSKYKSKKNNCRKNVSPSVFNNIQLRLFNFAGISNPHFIIPAPKLRNKPF